MKINVRKMTEKQARALAAQQNAINIGEGAGNAIIHVPVPLSAVRAGSPENAWTTGVVVAVDLWEDEADE